MSEVAEIPPARFSERLSAAVKRCGNVLCAGIDPHPDAVGRVPQDVERFGRAIVAVAAGRIPAVKPQFAFFEALGPDGMGVLASLCQEAREAGLLVIGDAKRGDIGSTAEAYAAATLSPEAPFPCDALTLSPYLGPESLSPFLAAADRFGRGVFVLLRTSNPGSERWQLPVVADLGRWVTDEGERRQDRDGLSGVGVVVGATKGEEIAGWRRDLPHAWMLVPGYGAQGGSALDALQARREDGLGALVVSARGISIPGTPDARWHRDPRAFVEENMERAMRELRC